MHESTVSRVTNEKFVQTPRGVLPLKFFFSSGLSHHGRRGRLGPRHQGPDREARRERGSAASAHRPGDRQHPEGERRADRASHRRQVPRPAGGAVGAHAEAGLTRPRLWPRSIVAGTAQPTAGTGHVDEPRLPSCVVRRAVRRVGARPGQGRGREPPAVHGAGRGGLRPPAVGYEVIVIDDGSDGRHLGRAAPASPSSTPSCASRATASGRGIADALRTGYLARQRRRPRLLSGRPAVQARGHPAPRRADPRRRGRHGHRLQAGEVREGVRLADLQRAQSRALPRPGQGPQLGQGVPARDHGDACRSARTGTAT